jgi:hypothetical protein
MYVRFGVVVVKCGCKDTERMLVKSSDSVRLSFYSYKINSNFKIMKLRTVFGLLLLAIIFASPAKAVDVKNGAIHHNEDNCELSSGLVGEIQAATAAFLDLTVATVVAGTDEIKVTICDGMNAREGRITLTIDETTTTYLWTVDGGLVQIDNLEL